MNRCVSGIAATQIAGLNASGHLAGIEDLTQMILTASGTVLLCRRRFNSSDQIPKLFVTKRHRRSLPAEEEQHQSSSLFGLLFKNYYFGRRLYGD